MNTCAVLSHCFLLPSGICKDVAAAHGGLFSAKVEAMLRMLGQQVFGFLMFRDLLYLLWATYFILCFPVLIAISNFNFC